MQRTHFVYYAKGEDRWASLCYRQPARHAMLDAGHGKGLRREISSRLPSNNAIAQMRQKKGAGGGRGADKVMGLGARGRACKQAGSKGGTQSM